MSLGARATKGGAKAGGKDGKHAQDKGKGPEKPQPKEKVKPQATTEQMRMASMIDRKTDDVSEVRRKVLELVEATRRPEEEVLSALHDAEYDMEVAGNLLLENQRIQGEWKTSEKKKKKPPAPVGNGDVEPPREQRSRSGPRTRRGGGGGGGSRGRGRGGRVSRGGRPRRGTAGWTAPQDCNNMGDSFPTTEDWDNEEWSGSLSDTKVFTPSASTQNAVNETEPNQTQINNAVEDWDNPEETNNGHGDTHLSSYTYHNANPNQVPTALSRTPPVSTVKPEPAIDAYSQQQQQQHHQPMGMSGSLTAAQSQYLSQLTQQSQRHDNNVYPSNYGVYSSDVNQRKPQRARVPPPSKIPSSAVEMPGGGGGADGPLLDVQFGEHDVLRDSPPDYQVSSPPEPQPAAPVHESSTETSSYANTSSMLSETLSVVDPTPSSQPPTSEPTVTNSTSSLEKQLTSHMKQLSVSSSSTTPPQPYVAHRAKTVGQQNMYATHHAVTHPAVYGANVYAPQANSTNAATLTGQPAMTAAYPSSVTISQYQPMINSYQSSSSAALYTAAPYSYQPHAKLPGKDVQYDSPVASSNSLTNTSTTQTSTAKVTASTASNAANSGPGYVASPALYTPNTTFTYDETCMRSLPHHMGGYYEVGYGVGGAREGTFNERFGRADAASPQQVPAALPPGYAYFYQPPPTTYQYGVYPYGGGSNVSGAGKVSTYTQQQPAYDAQDTYKAGGGYASSASKAAATANAGADLAAAMYGKGHVALNKVNSYDKAGFHSGTPPPFGAGSHHMYIPAPPHHHLHVAHQESGGSTGGGARGSKPTASKPAYSQSYWPPN